MNKIFYYLLLIIVMIFAYSLSFSICFHTLKGPGCKSRVLKNYEDFKK